MASAVLANEATYEFSLTLQDNLGSTGQDAVQAVAAMPPSAAGGGGSTSLFWGMALWAWVLAVCWQQRPAHWRKSR